VEHAPCGTDLGGARRTCTLFTVNYKRVLSKNLDQIMLKNAYFLENNYKNRLSVGTTAPEPLFTSGGWGIRPQTPALLLPPTITTLSRSFLALNAFYYPQNGTK